MTMCTILSYAVLLVSVVFVNSSQKYGVFTMHEGKVIVLNEQDVTKTICTKRDEIDWNNVRLGHEAGTHKQMRLNAKSTNHSWQINASPISLFLRKENKIDAKDKFWRDFCSACNVRTVHCTKSTTITVQRTSPVCLHVTGTNMFIGVCGERRIILPVPRGNALTFCEITTKFETKIVPMIDVYKYIIIALLVIVLGLAVWIGCIAEKLRKTNRQKKNSPTQQIETRRHRPTKSNHDSNDVNLPTNPTNKRRKLQNRPASIITERNTFLTAEQLTGMDTRRKSLDSGTPNASKKDTNSRCRSLLRGQIIGSGKFGKLYLSMDLNKGVICVVKQLRLTTRYVDKARFKQELNTFKKTFSNLVKTLSNHPHIAPIFGYNINNQRLSIFLPFYTKSSVACMCKNHGAIPIDITVYFAKQLLETIVFLHSNEITHGAIKGSNILIGTYNQVKLTDIGMSNYLRSVCSQQDYYNNLHWCSPEIIISTKCNTKASDIWSFGITVIEMLTSKPLWYQIVPIDVMSIIAKLQNCPVRADQNQINEVEINNMQIMQVLIGCLEPQQQRRMTASQLLQLDLFTNVASETADFSAVQETLDEIVKQNEEIMKKFKYQYNMQSPV